jgi:hypothetical protein
MFVGVGTAIGQSLLPATAIIQFKENEINEEIFFISVKNLHLFRI